PENMAWAMATFSLGRQKDLYTQLRQLNTPQLYISGQKDLKYHQLYKDLCPLLPNASHISIPNAYHCPQLSHAKSIRNHILNWVNKHRQ
ncbi:MAG: hypothetical protein CL521_00255, partial [Actinobacteria bacterium]|nr:hypothetical protein [Actinomycetota bacterium]